MTSHPDLPAITLRVSDRSAMDRELDTAEAALRDLAVIDGGCGILVTRHSHGTFTLSLTPEVPFGITQEAEASATLPTAPAKQEEL